MKRSQEAAYLKAKEIFSRIDPKLPPEERTRLFREMAGLPPEPVVETKQRIIAINWADRRDIQINRAMKALYDEGCRRLRAVTLPKNGDYDRVRVMGWPA
jgi:hypothetical protein